MDKDIQDVYVAELLIQSSLAALAQGDMNSIFQVYRDPKSPNKAMYAPSLFRNLHSMLSHAGNISKIFWPIVSRDVSKDDDRRVKRQQAIDRGVF
jgi:hypothetical protein